MTTRFVHVVRCKGKNSDGTLDDTKYADVQVIDQICLTTDNGGQETFNFTAANAVPTIVDVAGDGGGADKGSGATRQSRLIRVTNPNDSSQFFNEEVLDQVCVTRGNGAQEIWNFSQVAAFVSLTTGPDIDAGSLIDVLDTLVNEQSAASRLIEVDEILPNQTIQPPPQSDGTNYVAIADIQKLCITVDNGEQVIFDFSDGFRDITDTTQYTTDTTGNQVPPDNTDPDPYIVIPSDSSGLSTGNSLVQQGPLWKIINFSSGGSQFIAGGNSFDGMGDPAAAPVFLLKEDGSHKTIATTELDLSLPFLDGSGGYAWEDANLFLYVRYNSSGALVFTAPNGAVGLSLDKSGNFYLSSFDGATALITRVTKLGVPTGAINGASGGYQQGNVTAIGSNAIFAIGFDITGNTIAQKLTFDGSPGWGPVSLAGSPAGCATDGTDLWIATENLSQVGGNLTKLSGKTGNQILVVPQSPLPVGLDIDGSGNPIVILTVGGSNAYQYIVRSFARDGTLKWSFLFAPPGPSAPSEVDFGWLPAGARGVGGNGGGPSLAAGTKTIALAYGWQNGPFVPAGDISYALQTIQSYTGNTGFNQQGSMADMETALINIQPYIGTITINDLGPFPPYHFYSVTTTASAYPGGATSSQNFNGMESAVLWASRLPIWSSAEVVTTGKPTGAQPLTIETFMTGLDAKTGAMKWQLTGNGITNDNGDVLPMSGTLPFVPVVNRTGR